MKKVVMLISLSFIWLLLSGQTLNNPESIAYDYDTGWRYISNNGDGSILRDNNDSLYTYFSQGLGGVRGLIVHEQRLYAATNQGLTIFDLATDQHIIDVPIPGSSFLNDVVADNSGNIYISDNQAHKIFKYVITSGQVSTFISTGIQNPNGMCFDASNDRLLLVSFRANSPIQAIQLPGGTVSTALTTTIGNLDGIGIDRNGAIYFSSWQTNSVYRLTSLTANLQQIWTGFSGPADFFLYDDSSNNEYTMYIECEIWIPNMTSNSLTNNELPNIVNHMNVIDDAQNPEFTGWVSNSEFELMGYNLYNGGPDDFDQATLVNPTPILAQNTENAVYQLHDYVDFGADFLWLEAIENDGTEHLYGPLFVVALSNDDNTQPSIINNFSIYPNPIVNNASISFETAKTSSLRIRIYDVKGREVCSTTSVHPSGKQEMSLHSLGFDLVKHPSGIYFCHIETGDTAVTKKLVLVK